MLVPYDNRFSLSKQPWSVALSHDVHSSGGMDYPPFLETFKNAVARGLQGLLGLGDAQIIQNPDPGNFNPLNPMQIDYTRPLGVTFAGGAIAVDPTKVNVPTLLNTVNAAQTAMNSPNATRESVTQAVQNVLNMVNSGPVTAAQAQNISDTQSIATNVQALLNSIKPTSVNVPVGYGATAPFWSQADAQQYAQELAANPDLLQTLQAQAKSQLSTDSMSSQASGSGGVASSLQSFITNNPMLSLGIALAIGYMVTKGKKGKGHKEVED